METQYLRIYELEVQGIEEFFKLWGERNNGKSILLFNEEIMTKFSNKLKKKGLFGIIFNSSEGTRKISGKSCIIEWSRIGERRAILKSITSLDGKQQIYSISQNGWGDDKIFYVI